MTTRPTQRITRSLLACGIIVVVLLGFSAPASAHNSLLSSNPTNGATLDAAPAEITWVFATAVPLDTLTVTLIDGTGVRAELTGSRHGTSENEVITPLPTLAAGPISVRWRLVGPDGHPVSGRVDFTIGGPASSVPSDTGTGGSVPATTEPGSSTPDQTLPTTPLGEGDGTGTAPDTADLDEFGDGSFSTPEPARWVLRYGSYLAIMGVVGILITSALVWPGAERQPVVARFGSYGLAAVAALTTVQLVVLASDITGTPPWEALSAIDTAAATDAGGALLVRIVAAATLWLLMFRHHFASDEVRWPAVSVAAIVLLGTWAFAGHSRTQRWPVLGVVSDVVHHAAAAGWVAGLLLVGGLVAGRAKPSALAPIVRRFSSVATACVVLLVVTGAVQSVRLVGSPTALLEAQHGRYLAAKLVLVAAMLAFAQANRRRVARRLTSDTDGRQQASSLRRAMLAEFVVGLVVIGITAAMVAAPPSMSAG